MPASSWRAAWSRRSCDELTARADIVLIDAPPLLHVGDAMALTAKVDAVVLVARLNVLAARWSTEVRRMPEQRPVASRSASC